EQLERPLVLRELREAAPPTLVAGAVLLLLVSIALREQPEERNRQLLLELVRRLERAIELLTGERDTESEEQAYEEADTHVHRDARSNRRARLRCVVDNPDVVDLHHPGEVGLFHPVEEHRVDLLVLRASSIEAVILDLRHVELDRAAP